VTGLSTDGELWREKKKKSFDRGKTNKLWGEGILEFHYMLSLRRLKNIKIEMSSTQLNVWTEAINLEVIYTQMVFNTMIKMRSV
jgi:hypothetical protein